MVDNFVKMEDKKTELYIKCEKCGKFITIDGHRLHDWVVCPYCHWWNEL